MSITNGSQRTILVTDAGRGSAVAIIRALGRRSWRVIAADADADSIGFRSRYAAARAVYPSPDHEPRAFVTELLNVAKRQHVDLVIPVTDNAILPLSAARSEFDGVCRLALPRAEVLETAQNKTQTLELARRLGVPVPQTVRVETAADALAAVERFNWPVVLKPEVSKRFENGRCVETLSVCYADDGAQLAEHMGRFEGRCAVLLQEYVTGEGHGVELLLDEGRPLLAFQHRRLREIPVTGGASSYRESVPLDAALYRHAVRLLQELRWTGLAMVEFKVHSAGATLMEINGRVWGSLPLAVHCGVDFPGRLVELYLDGSPTTGDSPQPLYPLGVRCRNLELDLMWIASVLLKHRPSALVPPVPRRRAVAALFSLLDPRSRSDLGSLDDPRPALAELPKIVRKFRRKLAGFHDSHQNGAH